MAEAIGQVEQDGRVLAEQMGSSMSGVQSTVTDTSEVTRSGVESSRAMVAQLQKQSEQLTELAKRVSQLEFGFRDVAELNEVSTLIEIERDNSNGFVRSTTGFAASTGEWNGACGERSFVTREGLSGGDSRFPVDLLSTMS